MHTIQIQPATPDDAQEISDLILALSDPFYTSPTREGAEPFLAAISEAAQRKRLAEPNFSYYVARSGPELAGVVTLRDNDHLFHLFVAPPFQGQRLASRLWELVKSEAIRLGNPGNFTVNASLNAVPVYQRFGFVCVGEVLRAHGIACQPMRLSGSPEPSAAG